MGDVNVKEKQPSAEEHARAMASYIEEGTKAANELGNRGPIRLDENGKLDRQILDAYWRCGFYVFEQAVSAEELAELRQAVADTLGKAPVEPDAKVDSQGRPAFGSEFVIPPYRFAKPLSDPLGGTTLNRGRHPVKMQNPQAAEGAPEWTVNFLDGNLHIMDASLRLYGHPGLLAIAEAINGADFVPYNEATFIKEPGLGPSVAWHQDGTTHWDAADWDEGAHGFNFMTQLYPSTPGNCVWVLPGSHKNGKADIKALVAESGSERIKGAVPMMSEAGDVLVMNRQIVHGSFANTSPDRRVTLNAGFFPRSRVLNVTTRSLKDVEQTYTEERIHERSKIIALGIDARRQRFPNERHFTYQPLASEASSISWNEVSRETMLKNYNLKDMYI